MQKRTYYIPTIEITTLNTERLMGMGDTSTHAHMPRFHREKAF